MAEREPDVTLVSPALDGLPGQERYVHALRAHLPNRVRHVPLIKPTWTHDPVVRTISAWVSYPWATRDAAGTIVHGTDTFCAVPGVDVVTVHDLIPLQVSKEWTARLHMRLFLDRLRAAHIITLTQTWARRIEDALGVPPEQVHVIPQGCSIPPTIQPATRPAAYREDRAHILVVGAYRPYKRIHEILAAASDLANVRVVRVGPPGRGPYHELCVDEAKRLGADFVDLGPVPDAELPDHYAAADLVFYASEEEGFGFPPLEAMACGTTSLVSDIPVFRELYGDHVLYTDGDLLGDVRRALADPLPPDRLRQHATRFTWEETARRTAEVYRRVARDKDGWPAPAPSPARTPLPRPQP